MKETTMIEYTVKVDADGDKFWYVNGKLHREDGPACEHANGDKRWYLNGHRHREDGPAAEYANGTKRWYLNGQNLAEAEFNARLASKKLTVGEIQALLGYKVEVVS